MDLRSIETLHSLMFTATRDGVFTELRGYIPDGFTAERGLPVHTCLGLDRDVLIFDRGKGVKSFSSSVRLTDSSECRLFTILGYSDDDGIIQGLSHFLPPEKPLKTDEMKALIKEDKMDKLRSLTIDMLRNTEDVRKKIKEEQRKIQELEQLKKELISTVSHELRTPLSIINEGVSIVLDGVVGDVTDKQRHFLNTVKNNVDRLNALINDLLDMEKLEAGKMEFFFEPIAPERLLQEVYESFSLQMENKNLHFVIEKQDFLPLVSADHQKIMQVFFNLLSNAMKFTEQNGTIILGAYGGGNGLVTFYVKDSGIGIPEEHHDAVFDKFRQVGRKDGPGHKGTGLGLAISKKLIDNHGGTIRLESAPGQGSSFFFTIPVAEGD